MSTKNVTFVATDGTLLTDHTSDGVGFTLFGSAGDSSDLVIRSNAVAHSHCNSTRSYATTGTNSSGSDATLDINVMDFNTPYHSIGIWLRTSGSGGTGTGYLAYVSAADGTVNFYRQVTGSGAGVGVATATGLTAGNNRSLRFKAETLLNGQGSPPASGDCVRLSAYINGSGTAVYTYDDTHASRITTDGPAGIWSNIGGSTSTYSATFGGIKINGMTIEYTSAAATEFTMTNTGATTTAGWPHTVTVTPNANFTGTITVTPSGAGLDSGDAVVLTFTDSNVAQTATFYPTEGGVLTLVGTDSGSLTDPADLTPTIVETEAHGFCADYPNKVLSAADTIPFYADHACGVTLVEWSLDNWSTVFYSTATKTLNTARSNSGTLGVKYTGLYCYNLPLAPSDFASSGSKTIYCRVTGGDTSVTNLDNATVFVNKGDITMQQGYVAGTGNDASAGTSTGTARATLNGASGIFVSTDHVHIQVGAAASYEYDQPNNPTDNTVGWFHYIRDPAIDIDDAVITVNGATNGRSPGPPKVVWENIQFGSGVAATQPYILHQDTQANAAHVFLGCLFQGPAEGAPYYGLNWQDPAGQALTDGLNPYFFNSSFIGIGAVKYNALAVGCLTRHGVWGWAGGPVVNCVFEHVTRPANEDTLPVAGGDIHDDIMFHSAENVPSVYIYNVRATNTATATRGFKFDGDGTVSDHVIMDRVYAGRLSSPLGTDGVLAAEANVTLLRDCVITGGLDWTGTGNPPRTHNCLFRAGGTYAPRKYSAAGYDTWDEGGKLLFLSCWADNTLTVELAHDPDHAVVVVDEEKFTLSGAAEAVITGAAYDRGEIALTKTGDIYDDETPTLTLAAGAITVNGVANEEMTVTMEIIDNYSAAGAAPEPEPPVASSARGSSAGNLLLLLRRRRRR